VLHPPLEEAAGVTACACVNFMQEKSAEARKKFVRAIAAFATQTRNAIELRGIGKEA